MLGAHWPLHPQVHNEFILKSERDSFINRIRDIIHRVETLLRKDGRSGTELPKGPEAESAVGSPVSASLALPVLGKLLVLSTAWVLPGPRESRGRGLGCRVLLRSLACSCDKSRCSLAQKSLQLLSPQVVRPGQDPAGAWHSLAGASAPVLGSAHPSRRWTCSCRGSRAPSPPHPHSVVRLCPCVGPSCLPQAPCRAGDGLSQAQRVSKDMSCPG